MPMVALASWSIVAMKFLVFQYGNQIASRKNQRANRANKKKKNKSCQSSQNCDLPRRGLRCLQLRCHWIVQSWCMTTPFCCCASTPRCFAIRQNVSHTWPLTSDNSQPQLCYNFPDAVEMQTGHGTCGMHSQQKFLFLHSPCCQWHIQLLAKKMQ